MRTKKKTKHDVSQQGSDGGTNNGKDNNIISHLIPARRKTVTWLVAMMVSVMIVFQFIYTSTSGDGSLKQWQNQHSSLVFETSQLRQEQQQEQHRKVIDVVPSSWNEINATNSSSSSSSSSSGLVTEFADTAKDNTEHTEPGGSNKQDHVHQNTTSTTANQVRSTSKTISPYPSSTLLKNHTQQKHIPESQEQQNRTQQQQQEKEVETDDGIIHTCRYKNETYQMPHFPAFIIGGAQKTGTTSLENYFANFPGLAKIAGRTENHFFDAKIHGAYKLINPSHRLGSTIWRLDPEEWCWIRQSYFETWPEKRLEKFSDEELRRTGQNSRSYPYKYRLFEVTPSYLPHINVPKYLKSTCPWIPKVIMTLRDPVERAYSWYKMEMTYHRNDRSFEEWIKLEIDHMRESKMTTAPSIIVPNRTRTIVERNQPENGQEQQPSERVQNDEEIERQVLPRRNHILPHHKWLTGYKNLRTMEGGPRRVGTAIRRGMYAPQLEYWFQHYPADSILIIDYSDLKRNVSEVFFNILDFANVPYDRNSSFVKSLVGESSAGNNDHGSTSNTNATTSSMKKKKKNGKNIDPASFFDKLRQRTAKDSFPPMKDSTRKYLQAFYAPYNEQLEELLGDEWKKKNIWKY